LKWPGFFPAIFVGASVIASAEFPYSSVSSFFTVFVDGMFTTFIREQFTNPTEPRAQAHSVHCL